MWKESIDEWLAVFGKAASESQLAKADIDNVIKATRRMKSAAGLKASLKCVGTVALDMKRRDSKSLLTICDRRRLDENPSMSVPSLACSTWTPALCLRQQTGVSHW